MINIKDCIRSVADFPKPGIIFRDITGILETEGALAETVQQIKERLQKFEFTKIAALESRGFIFGAPVAADLNVPLILVRKPGKLPGEVLSQKYDLEYGSAEINIHRHVIRPGEKVVIIDDLLATGGTAKATAQLIEKAGGIVAGVICVIELPALKGREVLRDYPTECLVEFEGE